MERLMRSGGLCQGLYELIFGGCGYSGPLYFENYLLKVDIPTGMLLHKLRL